MDRKRLLNHISTVIIIIIYYVTDSDLVYHSLEEISSCFTISQSKRLKVPFVSLNKSLPSPIRPVVDCSKQLLELLENAVRKRVINSSKANIGILFSGGIDSSVLAALADKSVLKLYNRQQLFTHSVGVSSLK